jgi:hypothetical protein
VLLIVEIWLKALLYQPEGVLFGERRATEKTRH